MWRYLTGIDSIPAIDFLLAIRLLTLLRQLLLRPFDVHLFLLALVDTRQQPLLLQMCILYLWESFSAEKKVRHSFPGYEGMTYRQAIKQTGSTNVE